MAISVGTLSHAAAAAAFLFFSVLLLAGWRGRLPGLLLAAGSLVTVLWAGLIAYHEGQPGSVAVDALELIRSASWLAFLIVLLGYASKEVRRLRLIAAGIALFCGVTLVSTFYFGGLSTPPLDAYGVLARLLLAVAGMVLIEQLYRNIEPHQRWGIKFLCLGLGGIFACDFYLYSDALLFRRISEDVWAARGVVNALVVPLLGLATARNPSWSLDVSVSRRIVFHSTAILGAAIYLMVMAMAGYYIRFFGGNWGAVLQVTFMFGAALLLCVIVFSGTLRSRLKVFLSKNFFSYHYDYRDEWLRFTRTLSEGEPGIQLRERSIQAIAQLVDSPAGALWLDQDTGRFEPVAHWNMPAVKGTATPDTPLVQFMERRQWVIDLGARTARPEMYEGLEVPDWLSTLQSVWLVVPLILHERLLGFVVLARSRGRIDLNWEISDLLKTAGRQAASYLAQIEAAKALLVARQFESFNRMSAFVVHDLKNLIAQLSLLLTNAERHKHNPSFQEDMLGTIAHSVDKMKRLLFQLRGSYSLEAPAPVALDDLLKQVITAKSGESPVPTLAVGNGSSSVVAHRARLERIIGNLIQNSIDATTADGKVRVQLTQQNSSAVIEIADTGCGMSEQFIRHQLFKPFESTKPTGMGIGTYEASQYVRELGGRIEVESRESHGTVFRVMLPLYMGGAAAKQGAAVEGQA
jgi:putative PEP-CTERM system histidine kinase